MVYVTYVVSFLSLWLIVTFTTELYLSIHWQSMHERINKPRRAAIIALLLGLVSCTIYAFSFWLTRTTPISEDKLACEFHGSRTAEMSIAVIDTLVTLVLPFGILLYMNAHILSTVAAMSRQDANKSADGSDMKEGEGGGGEHHGKNIKDKEEPQSKTMKKQEHACGGDNDKEQHLHKGQSKKPPRVVKKSDSNSEGGGKHGQASPAESVKSFRSSRVSRQSSVDSSTAVSSPAARGKGKRDVGVQMRLSEQSLDKQSSYDNFTLLKYEEDTTATLSVPTASQPHHPVLARSRSASGRSTTLSTQSSTLKSPSLSDSKRAFVSRSSSSKRPSLGLRESTKRKLIRTCSDRYRTSESRSPRLLHKVIMPKAGYIADASADGVSTDACRVDSGTHHTPVPRTQHTPTHETIRKRTAHNLEHIQEKYHNTIEVVDDLEAEHNETDNLRNRPPPKGKQNARGAFKGNNKRHLNPLTKLQQKCFKMIVSVAVMFMILNLPSHAIRLQSLFRSLFDASYTPSQLEFHLQQFFLTVFYLNFVLNVIIYGACDNVFRQALLRLPWHVASSVRQLTRLMACRLHKHHAVQLVPGNKSGTGSRAGRSSRRKRRRQNLNDSRLVEIQIPNSPASPHPPLPSSSSQRERYVPLTPTYVHPSPPCLLKLSQEKSSSRS